MFIAQSFCIFTISTWGRFIRNFSNFTFFFLIFHIFFYFDFLFIFLLSFFCFHFPTGNMLIGRSASVVKPHCQTFGYLSRPFKVGGNFYFSQFFFFKVSFFFYCSLFFIFFLFLSGNLPFLLLALSCSGTGRTWTIH